MSEIQVLARAIGILEYLSGYPNGARLSAIASDSGLGVQTAQGILRTLQAYGWIDQDARGGPYRLGSAFLDVGRRYDTMFGIAGAVESIVREVATQINEYVILAELRGAHVFGIVEAAVDRELTVHRVVHSLERTHCMATGKILLAYLPEEERNAVVEGLPLKRYTPNTITDADVLRDHLLKARSDGYSVSLDESSEGVSALAVPVRDPVNGATRALGTYVPSVRFTHVTKQRLRSALLAAAHAIEGIIQARSGRKGAQFWAD